ncbi:FAD-dependent oxidoreductase (plasmid) [Prescottella equi]|uniref:NAD(P)/FAD-dependent oxidoreductase n=1 Tax=Rhodococcus hoagii TaxID=43767 RepID=UPI0013162A2D|nr:FAD-dependent oxidoreductase [Prescottella equi]QGP74848.1 Ferredoxin reductase [Rhodococcus sp. (in: high G+C Gram-positive bacteria)]WJJ14362.1 FAD-dependent oxidoreductase [Prescottella equi]
MTETYAVVGASLAGARAVETLRKDGFAGRVVLIGAEHHLPYDRPPLSKEVMLGRRSPGELLIHPANFYSDNDVDLMLGVRATGIDTHGRRIELASGRAVAADKVLLCTGTTPRRPAIPGLHLEGVHFLRTVEDSLAIRDALACGISLVIIGGGLIGIELAASARALGNEVTVLERESGLMRRVLGARIGDRLSRMHSEQGIRIYTDTEVDRIAGDRRVRRVHTSRGAVIDADVVVVGVGVLPATEVAEHSGIAIDNGIRVNEFCETTVSGVYAAGDVANQPLDAGEARIRLEHWQNAQNQGIAAARSMLGLREPFRDVPWFWSDQGETNIQAAGHLSPDDDIVWRGDPESLEFTAFHLRDSVLTGVVGVNRRRDVRMTMGLIDKKIRPEPSLLADPTVDLRTIGDTARSSGIA